MRKQVLFIIIFAALAAPIYAVTDQERSVLQRLHDELSTASKIIDEAEQAANADDRRQVDYQRLRDDLQKTQQGILDAINSERREPRLLPPIDGHYN